MALGCLWLRVRLLLSPPQTSDLRESYRLIRWPFGAILPEERSCGALITSRHHPLTADDLGKDDAFKPWLQESNHLVHWQGEDQRATEDGREE